MFTPVFSGFIRGASRLDLASDRRCFVAGYFEIIRANFSHIHDSAEYWGRGIQFKRRGRNIPPALAAVIWSPYNRFAAICSSDTMRLDIVDPVTLQHFQNPGSDSRGVQWSYSPREVVGRCSFVMATATGPMQLPTFWIQGRSSLLGTFRQVAQPEPSSGGRATESQRNYAPSIPRIG